MSDHDQTMVFEGRLTRLPEAGYETTLLWKANEPELPSNKEGSLKRLQSLNRKLQREGLTEQVRCYHTRTVKKRSDRKGASHLTAKGVLHSTQKRDSQDSRNHEEEDRARWFCARNAQCTVLKRLLVLRTCSREPTQ